MSLVDDLDALSIISAIFSERRKPIRFETRGQCQQLNPLTARLWRSEN